MGNFLYRSMGVPLYESDTAHLYIGVDNLDEALRYFEYAIAPDIEKQTSVSYNYTYTLTDTSDNKLGTVSFVPGSGTSVAEVTTDLPDLMYFNKVTFLQNSAWPHNSGESKRWKLGDMRMFSIGGAAADRLAENDRDLQWVLVREQGNGVMPMWVAITNELYEANNSIAESRYSPSQGKAIEISYLATGNWSMFSSAVPHAESKLWINEIGEINFILFYMRYEYYIDLNGHYVSYYARDLYGNEKPEKLPYLFAIDWIADNGSELSYTFIDGVSSYFGDRPILLFDGDCETKWNTHQDKKVKSEISGKDCWFVEFKSSEPITPTGYYMVTCKDAKKFPNRNPKIWSLYGKKNVSDNWELMDFRDNTYIPRWQMTIEECWTGNWGLNGKKGEYQYFRLEMYENWGDDCFQISEFGFNF